MSKRIPATRGFELGMTSAGLLARVARGRLDQLSGRWLRVRPTRAGEIGVASEGVVLDGYVRVSQVRGREGERFISPAVQRQQIEGWVALRDARLGEVFEELDESGARADRPLLEQALARIEAGTSQGLVVAKLDRFGRSLVDGLAAIERIQRAGGTFVSVADGFDLTTETGRLIMRIMLAMGEWQLDQIRSSWDAARERAVARGGTARPSRRPAAGAARRGGSWSTVRTPR